MKSIKCKMHSIWVSVRGFLKRNEIFIRIIETLILLVTLLVTIFTTKNIYIRQLEISQKQLKIDMTEANPIINCNIEYNNGEEDKIKKVDIMVDKNPINNLKFNIIPMYSIYVFFYEGYGDNNQPLAAASTQGSIVIPIEPDTDEELIHIYHGSNFGNIASLDTQKISEEYLRIFDNDNIDFSELSGKYIISTVELAYFIEVSYTDVLGDRIDEIYYCKPNYSETFKNKYNFSSGTTYLSSSNFYKLNDSQTLYKLYQKIKNSEVVTYNDILPNGNKTAELKESVEKALDNQQYYLIN